MTFSAIILGAGKNVGRALGEKLRQEGWKVALGSRNPDLEAAKSGNYHAFKIDLTKPETVASTLEDVKTQLGGPPNVVIYNAYDAATMSLPDSNNPLSIPLSKIQTASEVGFHSVYAAAQFATAGFATLPSSVPRVFIASGNPLPFLPATDKGAWLTLGLGKHAQAYFVEYLSKAYAQSGYQFYFASQVKSKTNPMGIDEFAAAPHATAFWSLINSKKQGSWDARFIKDGSFVTEN